MSRTDQQPIGDSPADLNARRPERIGKYRVLDRIGAGAMGVVYRCLQPGLDRVVAVKVLPAARYADPESLERFQTEARSAARLSHPNLVPIFDAGSEDGVPYLVMEYIDGPSLERLIGGEGLRIDSAVRIAYHLAGALQAVHDGGIIHRDLKPSNILIDPSGRPRLADFGLCRVVGDERNLSGSGDIVGTPRYMAPEQAFGAPDEVDSRSDVYSLGAVFYEMLCGKPMVDGANPLAVLRALADADPVPLGERAPHVPRELAAICERASAREPERRYPAARAFAEALEKYMVANWFERPEVELLALASRPVRADRRPSRTWPILLALLIGVAGLYLTGRFFPGEPPPARSGLEATPDYDTTLTRLRADLRRLPSLADPATHREEAAQALAGLNGLILASPERPEGPALRGDLLRRTGEYLGSAADLSGDAYTARRAFSRYTWEVVILGGCEESILRPAPSAELRADLKRLEEGDDRELKTLAAVMRMTATRDFDALKTLLRPLPTVPREPFAADAYLVFADAALKLEEAKPDDETKPAERTSETFRLIRLGLEADRHHAGLLFLRAVAWQRRAGWEGDGEDAEPAQRRHRASFDAAFDRFRKATPRGGAEVTTARAILLANHARHDPAFELLNEVAAQRPVPAHLHALRAWSLLHSAGDGALSERDTDRVLRLLEPAFETPPDAHAPYLTRAMALACGGRWADARRDLRECRRLLGDQLDRLGGPIRDWVEATDRPMAVFLDRSLPVLDFFSVPPELRTKLTEETLRRLEDPAERVAVGEDESRRIVGWSRFALAKAAVQRDDRAAALDHLRKALEVKLSDLTPEQARADDILKEWNSDEEFAKLYEEFTRAKKEPS